MKNEKFNNIFGGTKDLQFRGVGNFFPICEVVVLIFFILIHIFTFPLMIEGWFTPHFVAKDQYFDIKSFNPISTRGKYVVPALFICDKSEELGGMKARVFATFSYI